MIWLVSAFGAGLAVVAGVWWLRRTLLVVTVHGPSMLPTYREGDRLLVRRQQAGQLQVGQVVVADLPSLPLERIPDLVPAEPAPGEPVPGELVPGEPVPELPADRDSFTAEGDPPEDMTFADSVPGSRVIKRLAAVAGDPVPPGVNGGVDGSESTVPPGTLVLLGDNPSASVDSRSYGCVSADIVIGAVVRRLR